MEPILRPSTPTTLLQSRHASCTPRPLFFTRDRLLSSQESATIENSWSSAIAAKAAPQTSPAGNCVPDFLSPQLEPVDTDPFRSSTPPRQASASLPYTSREAENANGYVSSVQLSHNSSIGSHSFASVLDLYDHPRYRSAPLSGKPKHHCRRVSAESVDIFYQPFSNVKQSGATLTSTTRPGGVAKEPLTRGKSTATTSFSKAGHFLTDSEDLNVSDPLLTLFAISSQSSNPAHLCNSESSREVQEPRTPTDYSRGSALVEIINSYRLPRLRTHKRLDEQDTGREESYQLTYEKHLQPQRDIVVMPVSSSVTKDEVCEKVRTTPPRALFEDLQSAYSGITSRPLVNVSKSSVMKDLPLPPVPVSVRDRLHAAEELPNPRVDEDDTISKPLATLSSYFRRFSRQPSFLSFQPPKHDDEVPNHTPEPHQTVIQSDFKELVTPYTPHQPNSEPSYSLRSVDGTPTSDADLSHHDSDGESVFAFSARREDSQIDESTNSVTSQHDYSMGALIDSYKHTGADVTLPQAKIYLSRRYSRNSTLHSPSDGRTNTTTGNTMDSLLEKYSPQYDSISALSRSPISHEDRRLFSSENMPLPPVIRYNSTLTNSGQTQYDTNDKNIPPKDNLKKGIKPPVPFPSNSIMNVISSTAPLASLPATPTLDSDELTPDLVLRGMPTASCVDYGETGDLLLQSQSSMEIGRGAEVCNLSQQTLSSSLLSQGPPPKPLDGHNDMQDAVYHVSPADEIGNRLSNGSIDEVVTRDIRHLSAMSGLSNLSGSVYVFGNPSDPMDEVAATDYWPPTSNSPSSCHSSNQYAEDFKDSAHSTRVPFAAFAQSAVAPGYCRLSLVAREALQNSERQAQTHEKLPEDVMAVSKDEDPDEDGDWETIAESRRTLEGLMADADSFADVSSSNSISTYQNIGVHPGDARFQHIYRLHSLAGQAETFLLPSYNFRDTPGFPNRNALTPPTPIALRQTYKLPEPLPRTHENPFTSSPPPMPRSPSAGSPHMEPRIESIGQEMGEDSDASPFWHRQQLSVVYEQAEDSSRSLNAIGNRSRVPSPPEAVYLDASVGDSSDWLTSGPGPEITTAEEDTPRSALLSSGANAKLVHMLRQDDPRMASSPLSATNSFAKLSRLGPRANITGTPNGTGMREVGSSLVGSSSPFYQNCSSPLVAQPDTPNTPGSVTYHPTQRSPLVSEFSSPLVEYTERHQRARSTNKQSMSKGRKHFRDAVLSANRADTYTRPAIAGQTQLLQMNLVPEESVHVLTNVSRVREPFDRPSYRGGSNATNRPLLPLTHPAPALASPHLLRRLRAPSSNASELCGRKQKLSWICFAACALLPPLLVLYGYGYLDGLMFAMSHHDIEHFGTRQKRVARWVGFSFTTMVVMGLTILLIVLKTVPNDYPR